MYNIGVFANILYADTLELIWQIIDTNFPHLIQRSSSLFCSGSYSFVMHTLYGLLQNAGIKYKALNNVIFILCAKEEKYLTYIMLNMSFFYDNSF